MIVIVKTPFVGYGFNMPNPGELLNVPDDLAHTLLGMDVVSRYETKVDPLPEVKKNEPSGSSQAAPAPRKRTRRSSKKSVKKSS